MRFREVGRLRALCFDLENRPLAYWYDGETTNEITAFGWKWEDEPDVKTLLLTARGRYEDDTGKTYSYENAHLLFRNELCGAGLVYGHNIRRHDLPILQSWLLRQSLPKLPAILTTDTLRDYPRRNGLSASLENLASMYGLGGEKFTMSQPMWEQANKLTMDGVAFARKRVVSDVLLQEDLRGRLLDLGLLKPPRVWS